MGKRTTHKMLQVASDVAVAMERLERRLDAIADDLRELRSWSQRPSYSPPPDEELGDADEAADEDEAPATTARIDVYFPGDDEFLGFLGELSSFPEVATVTVAGSRSGRATLLVELRGRPLAGPEVPTIACVQCGRRITAGGELISHGLCQSCLDEFVREGRGSRRR